MSAVWYYQRDDKTEGPVYREDVEHLLRLNMLAGEDLVWRDGMDEWAPAKQLFDTNQPPPPKPPPPPPTRSPSRETAHSSSTAPSRLARRRSQPNVGLWIFLAAITLCVLVGGGWIISHQLSQPAEQPVAKKPTKRRVARRKRPRRQANAGKIAQAHQRESTSSGNKTRRPDNRQSLPPLPSSLKNGNPPPNSATTRSEPQNTIRADGSLPKKKQTAAAGGSNPFFEDKKSTPKASGNDNQPPLRRQSIQLYQDLLVQRKPTFNVNGLSMNQDIAYRVLSQLTLGPMDSDRQFTVRQKVLETKLDKADQLSRATFAKSLQDLVGSEFTFTLNRHHQVVNFKGHKKNRNSVRVQPGAKKDGFLVTNVMDEDGWKELAQLSFFVPEQKAKRGAWQREMSHDWGPLGSWSGTTQYRQGRRNGQIQNYTYAHNMRYSPKATPKKGTLPFPISGASFSSSQAGGNVQFDFEHWRVKQVEERFAARGSFSTQVLGQAAQIQLQEQQVIQIRLADENPWR